MKGIIILLLLTFVFTNAHAVISGSPHDVNVMRESTGELQTCAMCHTPHSNIEKPPLWNRDQPSQNYMVYESPSFDMYTGQVLQAPSTYCMTCHNGVSSTLVNYPGAGSTAGPDYDLGNNDPVFSNFTNMGVNLKNNHPVSFIYNPSIDDDDNGFPEPKADGPGGRKAIVGKKGIYPLYGNRQDHFECSTCHDVHDTVEYPGKEITDGKSSGKQIFFLRADNSGSGMCIDCHTNR
jgi:hypothetical protein